MSAQDLNPPPPPGPAAPAGGTPRGPAPPETSPWWQRGWAVALIALVCAGAGAGIAAAASGGGSSPPARTTTTTTVTVTVTSRAPASAVPAPAPRGPSTVTHTVTHTVTVTVILHGNEPLHTLTSPTSYSGEGQKKIGSIALPHGGAIHWHASGGHFTLQNTPETVDHLSLSESGTKGEAVIAEGTFPNLEVLASGHWEMTIDPG